MTEQANKLDYPDINNRQLENLITNTALDLNRHLTLYQMGVLLAAGAQVNNWILEPLTHLPIEQCSLMDVLQVDEESLLEIAQVKALEGKGLIYVSEEERWILTEYGALITQELAATLQERIQSTDWPITPILKKNPI